MAAAEGVYVSVIPCCNDVYTVTYIYIYICILYILYVYIYINNMYRIICHVVHT